MNAFNRDRPYDWESARDFKRTALSDDQTYEAARILSMHKISEESDAAKPLNYSQIDQEAEQYRQSLKRDHGLDVNDPKVWFGLLMGATMIHNVIDESFGELEDIEGQLGTTADVYSQPYIDGGNYTFAMLRALAPKAVLLQIRF